MCKNFEIDSIAADSAAMSKLNRSYLFLNFLYNYKIFYPTLIFFQLLCTGRNNATPLLTSFLKKLIYVLGIFLCCYSNGAGSRFIWVQSVPTLFETAGSSTCVLAYFCLNHILSKRNIDFEMNPLALMVSNKEHWYRGEADSSTTKLYSDNSLKSVF